MKKLLICLSVAIYGCIGASPGPFSGPQFVPSKTYSDAVRNGAVEDYSTYQAAIEHSADKEAQAVAADLRRSRKDKKLEQDGFQGDSQYLDRGYRLRRSMDVPSPKFANDGEPVGSQSGQLYQQAPRPPSIPPGSSAPYYRGQMRANPSLWPSRAGGAFLYADFRAFQAMDVVTIVVNEASKGKKKAETDAEGKYDLLAGISAMFGYETSAWEKNNESLDADNLISAKTEAKFEGEGETKREGTLTARISAVIMEVLPNGLLRVEGTKIISLNSEEEVMVLSGLVRPRDISADNQVDSSRIANMRIDFYGRGVIAEQQAPGWGARVFELLWPF